MKNKPMNQSARKYFKEIKLLIPSNTHADRVLIRDLKKRIIQLNIENHAISYDELIDQFGAPTDIAANYYAAADIPCLVKKLRRSQFTRFIIVVVILAALIFCTARIIYDARTYDRLKNSTVDHTQITIEEIN